MTSPSNACGSILSSSSSRLSRLSPRRVSRGSPTFHGQRFGMPRRSILKAPTPQPKRRSSLSFPWAGPKSKKSVKWPDTKSIGERALHYLTPLGSRLGLRCLSTPKPSFHEQLEEVRFISPNPSPDPDTATPLWIKRHALGAALLPGEDDEEDGVETPSDSRDSSTWFCGQVNRPSEEAMHSWLVKRKDGNQQEQSFAVAEDSQDSPCSTDDYDQV